MIQKIIILTPNGEPMDYVLDKEQDADWIELSPIEAVRALMTAVLEEGDSFADKGFLPFIVYEVLDTGETQMHPFVLDIVAFKEGRPDAIQLKRGPKPRTLN